MTAITRDACFLFIVKQLYVHVHVYKLCIMCVCAQPHIAIMFLCLLFMSYTVQDSNATNIRCAFWNFDLTQNG